MAEGKHHVFSARTTKDGLRLLNELKAKLGISWDELVVNAVCAHYGLDKGVVAILKQARVAKPAKPKSNAKRTEKAKTKQQADTAG